MDVKNASNAIQRIIGWVIVIGVLALAAVGVVGIVRDMMAPRTLISIGGTTFRADVAQTQDERYKGLSGRSSLGEDEAMLFVFDTDKEWAMVMRKMNFPIDMIWLDVNKKVVHVVANAQPDAEPYEVYAPDVPARYVLEIPAGAAKKFDISVGTQARFDLGDGA